MNLPVTDSYVEILRKVLPTLSAEDLVLTFGSRFHERIEPLVAACRGGFEVKVVQPESHEWNTRAGHNTAFKLVPDLSHHRRIRCAKDRLYQNVLLPDGRVVLCCMDWSGRHVLGNLLTQSYEEMLSGEEMRRVIGGFGDRGSGTLCWRCEHAAPA